jgi:hemoglobin
VNDAEIGFFFTKVLPLNMQTHIPLIADFWESILLDHPTYKGDPMQAHRHIHQLHAFEHKHFDRWVQLFCFTIDSLFSGNVAEKAKQRATSIATVMKIKIIHNGIQNMGK